MPFCDALIAKYVHPSLLTHPNTTGLLEWVEAFLFQRAFLSALSTLNPDRTHLDHSIWHLIKNWCTQLLFHVIFVSFRIHCIEGKGSYGVVRGSPRLGSRMLFSTCLLIIFIQSTNIDWSLSLCQAPTMCMSMKDNFDNILYRIGNHSLVLLPLHTLILENWVSNKKLENLLSVVCVLKQVNYSVFVTPSERWGHYDSLSGSLKGLEKTTGKNITKY